MKKNLLYRKFFLVIMASSIGLSGCNNGNKASQNDETIDNYVDSQQERLSFVRNNKLLNVNSKSIGSSSDDVVFGFNNIQIGTGINPITNEIYNSSKPQREDTFYYYIGGSSEADLSNKLNYVRPLKMCDAYSLVSTAEENAKVQSTSSSKIFAGETGGGMNLGIAKLKLAASYENNKIDEDGNLSIRKDIGAKLNCKIYSYADPSYDKGPVGSNNFGRALINSNNEVAKVITDIRKAPSLAIKQQKIKDFYTKFGTHMVSSVDIGEVASSVSIMTQNTSASSVSHKAAVSADFTYAGVASANASFKMASSNKFDSKSWNFKIQNQFYPNNTSLKDTMKEVEDQLSNMKNSTTGIIDFNNLKPTAANITLPTPPDLKEISFDQTTFENNKKALLAYASLEEDVPSFNGYLDTAKTIKSDVIINVLISLLNSIEANVEVLNKTASTSLVSDDYNEFLKTYQPIKKAADLSGLRVALESKDIKTINDAIKSYENEYQINSGTSQQLQADVNKFVKEVEDFKSIYPVLSSYFENHAYGIENPSNTNPRDWTVKIMSKATSEDKIIYDKYSVEYNSKSGNSIGTQSASVSKSAVSKSISLRSGSGNPFSTIYDNHIVTNFNVVPWSSVFPELAQTFTLDDTSEIVLEGIDKSIDDFERQYKYLLFVKKMDATTNNKLGDWYVKAKDIFKVIDKLKFDIATSRSLLDSSPSPIYFNSIKYNISSNNGLSDLNIAVIKYINSSKLYTDNDFTNWLKTLNILKQYSLIGNFGAIPAYSVHGGYNNSDKDDSIIIPMAGGVESVNYNTNSQGNSPIRTILHLMSMSLFNNKPVIAQSYNPGNVERKTYTSEPYGDDSFNNEFNAQGNNADNAINNMIPNDGSPYNIMGVVPIVTSNAKITEDDDFINISNIGLVDSSGNIWNPSFTKTNSYDMIKDNAKLFTLKINKSNGIATVVEAKFYEYHWKFGNGDNKSYNNMIMLAHNKSSDECWGKGNGHYTPTCIVTNHNHSNTTQPALDFFDQDSPRNSFFASQLFCSFKQSGWSTNNVLNSYFSYQNNNYEDANNDFCDHQFVEKDGNGYGKTDYNYERRKVYRMTYIHEYFNIFNKYRDSSEHIPHGLRLIPMSPSLITKISGNIDGNKQKLPLLSSYYF